MEYQQLISIYFTMSGGHLYWIKRQPANSLQTIFPLPNRWCPSRRGKLVSQVREHCMLNKHGPWKWEHLYTWVQVRQSLSLVSLRKNVAKGGDCHIQAGAIGLFLQGDGAPCVTHTTPVFMEKKHGSKTQQCWNLLPLFVKRAFKRDILFHCGIEQPRLLGCISHCTSFPGKKKPKNKQKTSQLTSAISAFGNHFLVNEETSN